MSRLPLLVCLLAALMSAHAAPAPAPGPAPGPAPAPTPDDNRPEIIEIIAPANSAQETLATLNLGAAGGELSDRNKRTIGILRQLFPTLTQIIEQKVQQITSSLLQTLGPVVLRAFLGNRGGGGTGDGGAGRGTVELDDDDDDEPAATGTTTTSTTTNDETESLTRRRRALFWPVSPADEQQLLSGAESQQAEVRVAFAGDQAAQQQQQAAGAGGEDQQTAAQTNSASIDEIALDDGDDSEENRNKRFLNFGIGGGASAGASGGGSGNFLFDIVRRAPEAMSRAAGAAWSLLAGAGGAGRLSVDLAADHQHTRDLSQLVAGSSSGAGGGDAGAAADGDDGTAPKGDNLTEGVPGPITRLFIIANRGIANLIQDLILRLAQTSERIVNFKARLITSII